MCCFNFWCVLCNSCTYFISIICFSDSFFTCCQSFVSFFHLSFFSSFVKGIVTIYLNNCFVMNFFKIFNSFILNTFKITFNVSVFNSFLKFWDFFIQFFTIVNCSNSFCCFLKFFFCFRFLLFFFFRCQSFIEINRFFSIICFLLQLCKKFFLVIF
ncbi:Uncharacterised protein [Streptococcus pyogenes]|nr:Uncharacterised protein [Streptococcus pyogenes]VGV67894.1 Uncharacterised protein [Streptococcus pyogenes]VHA72694.1 Uncharacterised protein [Streptococcus pyogenes]